MGCGFASEQVFQALHNLLDQIHPSFVSQLLEWTQIDGV